MIWTAILDNDEKVIDDGTIISWRKLKEKCDNENLKIKSLKVDDKEVDENADGYIAIFEISASLISGKQNARRGIGAIRKKNGAVRMSWYNDKGEFLYREVVKPISDIYLEELFIPNSKNSS